MEDVQELDASFLGEVTLIGEPVSARSSATYSRSLETDEDDEDDFSRPAENQPTDDLDEMDEDLEEEEEEPDAFEGPMTWEEVEMADLEPVMLRVSNAAMPLDNNKDLASRLEALQSNLADNDNEDPLGLGKIDVGNVSLVKHGEIAKHQGKKAERKKGRKTNDIMQSVASRLLSADVDIEALRAKALPSSEAFDPDTFLGTIHSATSLADLQKGRQNIKAEVSERTGQLKALVKENFDRFISCKNTIDDIHKRLKQSEAHGSGNGTSTSDMVVVIAEVQEEANMTFATLLDRATQTDQLRSVVNTLKRHDQIFQIPFRIRQGTASGDFAQVISEYKKARSLMEHIENPRPQSIWHKLFTEVEKVTGLAVAHLEEILRDLSISQVTAVDTIQHILQLQEEKSPSALLSSPIILHAQVRAEALLHCLQDIEHAHNILLENARNHEAQETEPEEKEMEMIDVADPNHTPEDQLREGWIWAKLLHDLSTVAAPSLPAFWHAPRGKLSQGTVNGTESSNESSLPMVVELVRRFERHANNALHELSKHDQYHQYFMSVFKCCVGASVLLRKTNAPPMIQALVDDHAHYACMQIIEQMTVKVARITDNIPALENFEIISSSHKAGHPASRVPTMMRRAISTSLSHLEAVVNEVTQADMESYDSEPLERHCSSLRRAFCDSFSNFALGLDKLWQSILAKDPATGSGQEVPRDIKLLVLQSNCVHLRTHILKDLVTRFGSLLTSDGGFGEHKQLMGECVEDMRALEGSLANTYIRARVEKVNEVLDEYFEEDGTDWTNAPIPVGVRDCCFEIIHCLVTVQTEVYVNALSLQRKALDEVYHHFLGAYYSCIDDRLEELNMGGALQLLLELQYFNQALSPLARSPQQKEQAFKPAKVSLMNRITRLTTDPKSSSTKLLNKWCKTSGTSSHASYRADVTSNLKCLEIIEATKFNTASLKAC